MKGKEVYPIYDLQFDEDLEAEMDDLDWKCVGECITEELAAKFPDRSEYYEDIVSDLVGLAQQGKFEDTVDYVRTNYESKFEEDDMAYKDYIHMVSVESRYW